MCDGEEDNSVLTEMLIKILVVIAIVHKEQFKTKGTFKYFNFLANTVKYWEESRVFFPYSDSGLAFCHRFRMLLSSSEKRTVVNEKETKAVLTSNSLLGFAQSSNVKGRIQRGDSGECAHTHTHIRTYI